MPAGTPKTRDEPPSAHGEFHGTRFRRTKARAGDRLAR
jgi:hypothetical protein